MFTSVETKVKRHVAGIHSLEGTSLPDGGNAPCPAGPGLDGRIQLAAPMEFEKANRTRMDESKIMLLTQKPLPLTGTQAKPV